MHTDKYIQALVSDQEFFQIHRENVLGSEMDVFKNRPRSLVDFLELSSNHGDQPYLIYQDKVITYAEHLKLVKKAASYFAITMSMMLNLETGWRFMLLIALNGLYFFWATVSIGAIACGLNGWWKGSEAIKAIDAADPKCNSF